MFEKVSPSHPDKIADRIAGAIVDLAYAKSDNPRIAVEILIGHEETHIVMESDSLFDFWDDVQATVDRITHEHRPINFTDRTQNRILHQAQHDGLKCGDNGIFKGCPVTAEEAYLTEFAQDLYKLYPTDGKYLLGHDDRLIVCHSHATKEALEEFVANSKFYDTDCIINPLGPWTGGLWVDTGAVNRKLGSDMGSAITGGGLHGKDLSKADVTLNIVCHLLAQNLNQVIITSCAIGQTQISFKDEWGTVVKQLPYAECVKIAKNYIDEIGGFEKFAEWGLIR